VGFGGRYFGFDFADDGHGEVFEFVIERRGVGRRLAVGDVSDLVDFFALVAVGVAAENCFVGFGVVSTATQPAARGTGNGAGGAVQLAGALGIAVAGIGAVDLDGSIVGKTDEATENSFLISARLPIWCTICTI